MTSRPAVIPVGALAKRGCLLVRYIILPTRLARPRQPAIVQIGQIVQIGHFFDHPSKLSNLSKVIKVNSRFPL
jgi:hypothetical protein